MESQWYGFCLLVSTAVRALLTLKDALITTGALVLALLRVRSKLEVLGALDGLHASARNSAAT